MLRLIKLWLKTPIEERDADGKRRLTGGKRSRCGTPQGGVVSPLLANLYMNPFLKHWRFTGCREAFRAQIIAYADDFIILSRGHAVEAMMRTKAVMTRLRLSLNEAKTSIRDARKERFEFLGYSFGQHYWWKNGQRYLGARPSKKSVQRIKAKISDLLVPGNKGSWPDVHDRLNRLLSGWSAYFSHGTRVPAWKRMRFEPERTGGGARIDAGLFPPCCFIATAMDLAMMPAAERHREFVAHLAAKRPWLSKAQMVRIRGRAAANQTGLLDDEPHVLAVANSARFGMAQFALVDACGVAWLSRLARADLAAFANPAWPVKLRKLLLEGILDLFGVCRDQRALCAEHPIGPGCGFLGRANALEFGHKLVTERAGGFRV